MTLGHPGMAGPSGAGAGGQNNGVNNCVMNLRYVRLTGQAVAGKVGHLLNLVENIGYFATSI